MPSAMASGAFRSLTNASAIFRAAATSSSGGEVVAGLGEDGQQLRRVLLVRREVALHVGVERQQRELVRARDARDEVHHGHADLELVLLRPSRASSRSQSLWGSSRSAIAGNTGLLSPRVRSVASRARELLHALELLLRVALGASRLLRSACGRRRRAGPFYRVGRLARVARVLVVGIQLVEHGRLLDAQEEVDGRARELARSPTHARPRSSRWARTSRRRGRTGRRPRRARPWPTCRCPRGRRRRSGRRGSAGTSSSKPAATPWTRRRRARSGGRR
ncbi:hypothetical protein SO694_0004111 [Aureococcus anophagefferens]|uniref:Uncharacterized protein n=1 Tax=Aureococcus anophagefferens TaxID=44056 RepID=A0ABR1G6I0_AURAN